MAKLVIGKGTPKSFSLKVEVPTPTGLDEVTFDARHLASTAWATLREQHAEAIGKGVQALFDQARKDAEAAYQAKLVEELVAAAEAAKGVIEDTITKEDDPEGREAAITALMQPVKESTIAELRARYSGELIAQVVTGWDLDAPMDLQALVDMCDIYPGAAEAVFKAYNETREGLRAKN